MEINLSQDRFFRFVILKKSIFLPFLSLFTLFFAAGHVQANARACWRLFENHFSVAQADLALHDYRNSGLVMSQDLLNQIIDAKMKENSKIYLGQFQTSTVRVAVMIPPTLQSVLELPPALVKLVNMADKAADREFPYSDDYMRMGRGDYIIFQVDSNGEPDFYIPPKDSSVQFEHRPAEELNQDQFSRINQLILKADPSLQLPFIGILNPQIIDVYSSRALGIKREDKFNLQATWGVSEKPADQDAVFARRHGSPDGEVWKIKVDDGTGQPMNYRRLGP